MLPRADAIGLYSHAAVFCCPSVYEPFGIINLEAMACETAVVASAVGGIPEVVVPGETGLLVDLEIRPGTFDPVDPAAFSRALGRGDQRSRARSGAARAVRCRRPEARRGPFQLGGHRGADARPLSVAGRWLTRPRMPADLEGRRRVVIDRVTPNVDGGAFPVKRIVGDTIVVEAVAYADGHDALACVLLHRRESDAEWVETRMEPLVNDRWRACFTTAEIGRYRYTVMAWIDRFATWAHDLEKRVAARQDLATDLVIGALLVEEAAGRATGTDGARLRALASSIRAGGSAATTAALSTELAGLMERHAERRFPTTFEPELTVVVDRELARFGAWYEMFPRSATTEPGHHGTFADVEARLPEIAEMAFDVLYLPPIHPIGQSYRKGRNNATTAATRRPWKSMGHRLGRGRPHCDPSGAWEPRGLPAPRRGRRHARPRDRPRHRVPDGARPSVRDGAPGVVPAPTGRDDPVRREPAEEIPGHLPVRLRDRRLAGAVGRAPRCLPVLARPGHPDLSGRQPAHQALRVLGMADRRRQARLPGDDLPRRGVHAAERPVPAGQDRLHPVVQLLPVAEHQGGADRVPDRADADARSANSSARTCGRTRPTSCRSTCSSAAARRSSPGSCSRRRSARATASTARCSSTRSTSRSRPARRSTSIPRNTRSGHGTSTGPDTLAGLIGNVNRIRREHAAFRSNANLRFHDVDNDQLIAYTKATDDGSSQVLVVVNLDPHHMRSGFVDLPARRARPRRAPAVPGARPAHRRAIPVAGSAGTMSS